MLEKENKKINGIMLWAFILSIALNILFLVSVFISLPDGHQEEEFVVEIDPSLIEQWQKEQKKLQIVQTEDAKTSEPPKDAKYLSKKNQIVEKETKAKRVDDFSARKSGVKTPVAGLQKLIPRKLSPNGMGELSKPQKVAKPSVQGKDSASDDFLNDVAEGERTLLSTKEYVYYGYFQRIRDRLKQNWNRRIRAAIEQHVRSGRHIVSQTNYVTKVIVILNRHGRIIKVKLEGSSGAQDLDRAAIDAFNAAGPFPNPPEGLIGKDGLITIPWHFILQS